MFDKRQSALWNLQAKSDRIDRNIDLVKQSVKTLEGRAKAAKKDKEKAKLSEQAAFAAAGLERLKIEKAEVSSTIKALTAQIKAGV